MTSSQAQPIQWSEDKYKKLESQLEGFWAQNEWDMSKCPLATKDMSGLRKIRFKCISPSINTEIKYACWYKFQTNEWSIKASSKYASSIHIVVNWLNTVASKQTSLFEKALTQWQLSLRSYLIEHGVCHQHKFYALDGKQNKIERLTNHHCVTVLDQIYKVLQNAYDDREEYDKDVWDLRKLGFALNLSNSSYKLNFTKLSQPWLLSAAKRFMKYSLSTVSVSHCQGILTALNEFSMFLSKSNPSMQARNIDRSLLVKYLTYLSSKGLSKATRKTRISGMKTFFRLCGREGWAAVPEKELIYKEDSPRGDEHQPRYIPQEVLDQLNQHINALPPHIMRMVLVHQETGRRIIELCTMPFDCLMQDVHKDWFLRYKNSKMKRERSIPISKEVATVILEQQEFVVKEWGKGFPYLFPTPKPMGKGQPIKANTFSYALNKLAYEKRICNATGTIWRFQSHQFRHTVGTKMANLGVPIHIIKQFLDHDTFEMSMRYIAIHDQTMKEEFVKFKDKMVDVTGKVVSYESVAADMATGSDPNSIDAQWLKKNIRAQALPNGLCALPVNQPECPYGANKCVAGPDGKGCPHFKTDIRYLDKHKEHLARTEEIVEWAQENPGAKRAEEIFKVNLPVKQNLERIVASLSSQPHA